MVFLTFMSHRPRSCKDEWGKGAMFDLDDSLVVLYFLFCLMFSHDAFNGVGSLTFTVSIDYSHVKKRVLSCSLEPSCSYIQPRIVSQIGRSSISVLIHHFLEHRFYLYVLAYRFYQFGFQISDVVVPGVDKATFMAI